MLASFNPNDISNCSNPFESCLSCRYLSSTSPILYRKSSCWWDRLLSWFWRFGLRGFWLLAAKPAEGGGENSTLLVSTTFWEGNTLFCDWLLGKSYDVDVVSMAVFGLNCITRDFSPALEFCSRLPPLDGAWPGSLTSWGPFNGTQPRRAFNAASKVVEYSDETGIPIAMCIGVPFCFVTSVVICPSIKVWTYSRSERNDHRNRCNCNRHTSLYSYYKQHNKSYF